MRQLRRMRLGPSSSLTVKVKLRKVIPIIPSKDPKKGQLMEDLTFMDCIGFAEKPCGFSEEWMKRELFGGVFNEFNNTLRGIPYQWIEEY